VSLPTGGGAADRRASSVVAAAALVGGSLVGLGAALGGGAAARRRRGARLGAPLPPARVCAWPPGRRRARRGGARGGAPPPDAAAVVRGPPDVAPSLAALVLDGPATPGAGPVATAAARLSALVRLHGGGGGATAWGPPDVAAVRWVGAVRRLAVRGEPSPPADVGARAAAWAPAPPALTALHVRQAVPGDDPTPAAAPASAVGTAAALAAAPCALRGLTVQHWEALPPPPPRGADGGDAAPPSPLAALAPTRSPP